MLIGKILHDYKGNCELEAKEIETEVNNLLFDVKKEFASLESEDICESKHFFWIAYFFILGADENYTRGYFDGRNGPSCEISHRIIQATHEQLKDVQAKDHLEESEIAKYLLTAHRTLQQTFASLCFYYLDQYRNLNTYAPRTILTSYAKFTEYEDWWEQPLI